MSVIIICNVSKTKNKQTISESGHYTRDWGVGELVQLSRARTSVRFHRVK